MLIRDAHLRGIEAGTIDLAFRRWTRPSVKTGGRLRTKIGELSIVEVTAVTEDEITDLDARRAGASSRAALIAGMDTKRAGALYRIRLAVAGPDPRIALRQNATLDAEEVAALTDRIDRFDASSRQGTWAWKALDVIAKNPALRAPDLAAALGFETKWFKGNVRKLKELGLTESLKVGYQLSPRGDAFVAAAPIDERLGRSEGGARTGTRMARPSSRP